ncbi:MAG: hypothetical protein ORN51_02905 [Akkermansiaceae bacterium]|nr:hypothetical protein [Akkermansiaceae bacterium]
MILSRYCSLSKRLAKHKLLIFNPRACDASHELGVCSLPVTFGIATEGYNFQALIKEGTDTYDQAN